MVMIMSLQGATKIIKILKREGYEAYIVGGAVRDYILRIPTRDIDITTNAKPYQVSKLFKTKPTGIKYGTVTALFNDETFEITTFRVDGEYQDNRHPEGVIYSNEVIEDVKRRDFTINGLLMDESMQIIDHVGGKADIEAKMIRAIGDPMTRFNEDALRMLRAFYFQAKLGFQIDRETRDAIASLKEKVLDIANERVIAELIKTLRSKYLRYAFKSMVTTGIHKVLPGLEKGIQYFSEHPQKLFVEVFFTASFALNGGVIPSEWKFSNKHKHRYQIASKLANEKKAVTAMDIYQYGIDLCLLANKVNYVLGRSKLQSAEIERMYHELPITSEVDLKLRPSDMIEITGKKAGAWVRQLQKKMVVEILEHQLKNEYEVLKAYMLSHLE